MLLAPQRYRARPFLPLLLLVLAGCQSNAEYSPVPALLTTSSPEVTAELASAATELMNGKRVTLGRSAFQTSSSLTLETSTRNSQLGRLGTGRIIAEPDALRLLRVGRTCVLEHINSGRKNTLRLTNCAANPSAVNKSTAPEM